MKDQTDTKTSDLFPEELIITKLSCSSLRLKETKDGQRVEMKLSGMTTARFETDLSNDDYLTAAAEFLVRLSSHDEKLAKSYIDTTEAKYSLEELCEFRAGANRPVVKNGCISLTFSTALDFYLDCVIVEKATLIKLIAKWVIMLAKGDSLTCYRAINQGYLRLTNYYSDGVVVSISKAA